MRILSVDLLALGSTVVAASNVMPQALGYLAGFLGSIYYGMQIIDWIAAHRKKPLKQTRADVRNWHREDEPYDGPNLP